MKVTNQVLLREIQDFREEFKIFKEDDYKPLKEDVKKNTEFRQKANGVMTAFALFGGLITGTVLWIMNRVFK